MTRSHNKAGSLIPALVLLVLASAAPPLIVFSFPDQPGFWEPGRRDGTAVRP